MISEADFGPGFTLDFIQLGVLGENVVDKQDAVQVIHFVLDDVCRKTGKSVGFFN